jgi:hypothetical protein
MAVQFEEKYGARLISSQPEYSRTLSHILSVEG